MNNKKMSVSIIIMIILSVTFFMELLKITSAMLVNYDQQHFYDRGIVYNIKNKDYSAIAYTYYEYDHKDVRKSSDYIEQEEIGHYYAKSVIKNAYEACGYTERADSINEKMLSIKERMGEFEFLADDIDKLVKSRVLK